MIFPVAYTPGLLEQDLYTLPLEAGLVYAVSNWGTRTATPLWPFQNESTTGRRNPTRHPGKVLAVAGGSIALGTLTALSFLPSAAEQESFALGPSVRGWIHAHLVTEIATSFAKNTFQRERPFYDTVQKNGTVREDDRRSFFSGHSSHAFTFANYSSRLVWDNVANQEVGLLYGAVSFGLATLVAGTRAYDGQHHWSDVVAGSAVGFFTSMFVYERMAESVQQKRAHASCENVPCPSFKVLPLFLAEPQKPNQWGLEFLAKL